MERYFFEEYDDDIIFDPEHHFPDGPEALDDFEDDELHDEFDDDEFDDSINDIDFSSLDGNFRHSIKKINRSLKSKKKTIKPVKKGKTFAVNERAKIHGKAQRKIARVIVPSEREVIVEGVNRLIMSRNPKVNFAKTIGYYRGRKLKELVFNITNDTLLDFNMELFNPSMPLDYLHATSLNLNNKILVADNGVDGVSYSDVMFNILANPTLIPNAKILFSGTGWEAQRRQPFYFKNKNIAGKEKIAPYDIALQVDLMQKEGDNVYFDLIHNMNRPFIPDGMDVIEYKVLPGMSVTICFYYWQKSLKKFFFKEAAQSKTLI